MNFTRKSLLADMYCDSDSQVKEIENLIQNNNEAIDHITAHNVKLTANKEAYKSEYIKIKNAIAPDEAEAIQSERQNIRDDSESKIRKQLQDRYGDNYDNKLYDEAVTATNTELSGSLFKRNQSVSCLTGSISNQSMKGIKIVWNYN